MKFASTVARARLKNPLTGEMEPLRNPEEITPNVLRHTAATWMAKRGVPLKEIAEYLGHTTTRMVEKHYAQLHPDWRDRAKAALAAEIETIEKVEAPALLVRRRRALRRAARAVGETNPNPLVGCVIARDGRILGEIWSAQVIEILAGRERSL